MPDQDLESAWNEYLLGLDQLPDDDRGPEFDLFAAGWHASRELK